LVLLHFFIEKVGRSIPHSSVFKVQTARSNYEKEDGVVNAVLKKKTIILNSSPPFPMKRKVEKKRKKEKREKGKYSSLKRRDPVLILLPFLKISPIILL